VTATPKALRRGTSNSSRRCRGEGWDMEHPGGTEGRQLTQGPRWRRR
jgi:hypothetical protein